MRRGLTIIVAALPLTSCSSPPEAWMGKAVVEKRNAALVVNQDAPVDADQVARPLSCTFITQDSYPTIVTAKCSLEDGRMPPFRVNLSEDLGFTPDPGSVTAHVDDEELVRETDFRMAKDGKGFIVLNIVSSDRAHALNAAGPKKVLTITFEEKPAETAEKPAPSPTSLARANPTPTPVVAVLASCEAAIADFNAIRTAMQDSNSTDPTMLC